jgi:hypothetical protein
VAHLPFLPDSCLACGVVLGINTRAGGLAAVASLATALIWRLTEVRLQRRSQETARDLIEMVDAEGIDLTVALRANGALRVVKRARQVPSSLSGRVLAPLVDDPLQRGPGAQHGATSGAMGRDGAPASRHHQAGGPRASQITWRSHIEK